MINGILTFSAIMDMTVTTKRSQVITFANTITMVYASVFIKNPADAINIKAFLDPFTDFAWIIITLSFFILGIFLLNLHRYNNIQCN